MGRPLFMLTFILLIACAGCGPRYIETRQVTDHYTLTIRIPAYRSMTETEKDYLASFTSPSCTTFTKEAENNTVTTNECFVDFTVDSFSDTTASILFSVYTYTGGAHGSTTLIPCNYDRRTLRPLKLKDIAPSISLTAIAHEARRQLTPRLTHRNEGNKLSAAEKERRNRDSQKWLHEGTDPVPQNFRVFTFDRDRIRIYFVQYQVACYAEGILTIDISRNNMPFWK